MNPAIVFGLGLGLGLVALGGRELAAAGRALGMPAGLIGLLETLALR